MTIDNKGPILLGVTIIFLCLSIPLVVARLYVKFRITRNVSSDDTLLLATLICHVTFCGIVIRGVLVGNGQHVADISAQELSDTLKMWYAGELSYTAATTFVRLSVGTLLLRLTKIAWHRTLILTVVSLSTIAGVFLFSIATLQCHPFSFFWSLSHDPSEGHCLDPTLVVVAFYVQGGLTCLCDWCLALLPWHMVRVLRSNRKMKIEVGLLLCFANLGCIAAMVRFYAIKLLSVTDDFTYNAADLAIWSSIEIGIATCAAASVSIKPLLRRLASHTGRRNEVALKCPSVEMRDLPSREIVGSYEGQIVSKV